MELDNSYCWLSLGENTAGTADPEWLKGYSIPYDIILRKKAGGKKEERGTFDLWQFSSPTTIDEAPLSWRWLKTWLPIQNSEWIPYFALLVHTAFVYLLLSLYLNPLVLLLLCFQFFPVVEERALDVDIYLDFSKAFCTVFHRSS